MEVEIVSTPVSVSLGSAFGSFEEAWRPWIAAEVNEVQVKVVKMRGAFIWHRHEREDELFWVVRGRLRMLFREGEVALGENELVVVPRGVEHCPVADEEAEVVMIEPRTILNVGDVDDDARFRPYAPRWLEPGARTRTPG
jgi:mannose-6-phosphate isomerase-like protein (cupin superfamily)